MAQQHRSQHDRIGKNRGVVIARVKDKGNISDPAKGHPPDQVYAMNGPTMTKYDSNVPIKHASHGKDLANAFLKSGSHRRRK